MFTNQSQDSAFAAVPAEILNRIAEYVIGDKEHEFDSKENYLALRRVSKVFKVFADDVSSWHLEFNLSDSYEFMRRFNSVTAATTVRKIKFIGYNPKIDLSEFFQKFPHKNLKIQIDLSNHETSCKKNFNDAQLSDLLEKIGVGNHDKIYSVRFFNCDIDKGILELAKKCPDLQQLEMMSRQVSKKNICEALKLFKKLQVVDLSRCTKILENSGEITELLKNHPIECLKLGGFEIADKEFEDLIQSPFLNLRFIDLSTCQAITGSVVPQLLKLPQLQYLNLSHCRQITDNAFTAATQSPKSLRLDLFDCSKVTEKGLKHLAQFPDLEVERRDEWEKIKQTLRSKPGSAAVCANATQLQKKDQKHVSRIC